jgi:WD40 repeat protein
MRTLQMQIALAEQHPCNFVYFCRSDFVITASMDGHVKFWKKQELGVEFVKHFRSHLGNIQAISVNPMGTLLATISNDKSLKVFDVINFGEQILFYLFIYLFIDQRSCTLSYFISMHCTIKPQ